INDHAGWDRVSSALFKRARAELAMQRRNNAIADLRTIVDKHPKSPEFSLATTELQKLGVSLPKRR
ncbi:MAG TPA: tetratricopeptide repeat protein, partial [Acidobacteriota bacterium]|nr:tetratricopeptide repeat protein [Acidobacteriota bacterium]